MLAPDTILQNRYRIVKLLAQGGMGAVYLAKDVRLGSDIALKETFFSDENLRRAFEREARLLANLRHPALPRVSDHFTEDEGQFLVMEFIPGDDLMQMITRRGSAFDPDEVLGWADQLLAALEYIHSRQPPIIHRDIKPQNIKLTDEKQIILLDFGLAKGAAWQMSRMTTGSSVFGYTPSYAPIEQIKGVGTDPRSDLYSLAATLYHLMTGAPPVDALTRVTEIADEEPDPLKPANELNAQVPSAIADVLKQSMMLNRERRPANAAEMRKILRDAMQSSASLRTDDSTIIIRSLPAAGFSDQKTAQESKSGGSHADFILTSPPIVGTDGLKQPPVSVAKQSEAQEIHRQVVTQASTKPNLSKRWKWAATSGVILVATILVIAISWRDAKQPPMSPDLSLQSFEFETATVNTNGEVEDRRRGQAPYYVEDLGAGATLYMVKIPGGSFSMGASQEEIDKLLSHYPIKSYEGFSFQFFNIGEISQQQVTLPTFYLGKFEVTQAQWEVVARMPKVKLDMRSNPSEFKGSNLPVEGITWDEAIEFCERLSRSTGRHYSLPTEEQWEYACRAGTDRPFAFGDYLSTEVANYQEKVWSPRKYYDPQFRLRVVELTRPGENYRGKTVPVGSIGFANPFGIYDLHGNVMEWCFNAPFANARAVRGGSYTDLPCTCDFSSYGLQDRGKDYAGMGFGFRVVALEQAQL